ncbi:hypothetical protein [Sulfuritalea sp.]|uniref:hypothetical protein n=1 Tax=Sulfuritalea sp. TaxID=2480090 RepID=UPI00286DD1D3|nr:hypothetical protein [Sulfuritalea sp.]
MTTATAEHRPPMPPAAREFPRSGGVPKNLEPGAARMKRLAARCGHALACVRHRDYPARGRHLTTVEPIIEERPLPGPLAVRKPKLDDRAIAENTRI